MDKKLKFLVHLHLYYQDQLDFFINKLKNISGCDWDLFVTVCEENTETEEKILNFKPDAKIIKVENIGYDAYPFIQVLRMINLDDYDYVLKIHSKNYSANGFYIPNFKYNGKHCRGYFWRNELIKPIIGSRAIFLNNLEKLKNDSNIGMLVSEAFLISFADNIQDKEMFVDLKTKLNIYSEYDKFLAGTMFIIKASTLAKLRDSDICINDFSEMVKSGQNFTLAHSIERVFTCLTAGDGLKICAVKNRMLPYYLLMYYFPQRLFSVRNSDDRSHKILNVFGAKLKFKRSRKIKTEFCSQTDFENISLQLLNLQVELHKANLRTDIHDNFLLITHELSFTGAPLVLLPVVNYLLKNNKKVTVVSIKDGKLRNYFATIGIDCFLFKDIYNQQAEFLSLANNYSTVICNTIVTSPFYDLLKHTDKNIIWWVHEGKELLTHINVMKKLNGINSLYRTVSDAKDIYAVSEYSKRFLKSYNTNNINILNYGVEDFYIEGIKRENQIQDKINIALIGTVEHRKGVDILLKVVNNLPEEYRNKIFVKIIGNDSLPYALDLKNKYKNCTNFKFCGILNFKDKNQMYKNIDVLVSVSRDDPMPVVITEAFVCKIPVLCTNKCGQYSLIEDFVDGLKIESDNEEQLKNKLMWIVDNKDKLKYIGEQGRNLYLKYFTLEKFENNLAKILKLNKEN